MYKEMLLAVDLANAATQETAVGIAVEQAKAFGARLHVVTVVPDFGTGFVTSFFPPGFEQQALGDADAKLHAFVKAHVPPEVPVQHVVAHGSIYREIVRVAVEVRADVIVMASHRPELQDHLIGPNALKVASHAPCSVLIVRG